MEVHRYRSFALTSLTLCAFGAAAQDDSQQREDQPREGDPDIVQAALDPSVQLEDPRSADVQVLNQVLEPEQLEPSPEHLDRIELPDGFDIEIFAENLINPRMIAVADDGKVYVTRREIGDVIMLEDTDGDGRADVEQTVANRPDLHGIAIDGSTVYLVTVNQLYRTERQADGSLGPLELLVGDLPDGGQHPNRTIVVGPDDKLYVSVGSTCNACAETSQESATLLRIEPDGSSRTIFASGLRNTIGFGFHPETDALFGMDHGIDWLGPDAQPEELNHIVEGNKYGWPYIYADGRFNPQDQPPNEIPMEEWAEQSTEPLGLYVAHSAPMQLAFYTGDQFPDEYQGDAFVAMRGSWNRNPPSGYEVLRIRFEDGEPAAFEPFAKGFVTQTENGWGHIGRLAGIAQHMDGSLLLSDDTNGVIYRISYSEPEQGSEAAAGAARSAASLEPTNAGSAEVRIAAAQPPAQLEDTPDQLALELLDRTEIELDVASTAFAADQRIPDVYAAEGENISPPLAWQPGPAGTQTYVLMVEDPDAADDPPHVHWLAYNLPSSVTELPEGVPGVPRVAVPQGVLQGRNDSGSTGWTGMKPPVDDPAHDYHFQVFALDTMLELPHGVSRGALLEAMEGHVLAAGEIVGTYAR